MTTETPPEPTPKTRIFLSDEPAKLAAYLKQHKTPSESAPEGTSAPPYDFVDFVNEMTMTDFTDDFQIRAILESQVQLLGTTFNYLMMKGDWKNLEHVLRTQKVMRDTMELMNHYPPLSYLPKRDQTTDKAPEGMADA